MTEKQQIRSALAEIIATQPLPILGARLGFLIRQGLPIDIRGRFGGLRAMIEQCGGDLLQPVGKQGVDDLYNCPGTVAETTNTKWLPNQKKISTWALWHNPQFEGEVLFDQSAGILISAQGAECEAPMIRIPRITVEDQKELISAFIETVAATDVASGAFDEVKESPATSCWEPFSRALKSTGLLSKWIPFRRKHLYSTAKQRLMDLSVDETVAEKAIERAATVSKTPRTARSKSEVIPSIIARDKQMNFRSIAELAKSALDHMTESQIEDLPIPLGAVWHALKNKK